MVADVAPWGMCMNIARILRGVGEKAVDGEWSGNPPAALHGGGAEVYRWPGRETPQPRCYF